MTTITKTKEAEKMGEYVNTSLDMKKKGSNRLIGICAGIYTVDMINGDRVDFRKRQFDKWAKDNSYVTDF